MFGMGFWELIVIAIVALLVLGPDKLPEAAKTISKGIRDFRKQTRELQQTIESDEQIGGAIRDIKSALRGEEIRARPHRPPVRNTVQAKPVAGADPGEPATADNPGDPDDANGTPGDPDDANGTPGDVRTPSSDDIDALLQAARGAVPRTGAMASAEAPEPAATDRSGPTSLGAHDSDG